MITINAAKSLFLDKPKDVPEPVVTYLLNLFLQLGLEGLDSIKDDDSLDNILGGDVFIAECEDDLLLIYGPETKEDHGHYNVSEKVMAWDSVQIIKESPEDEEWAVFFAATNNSGGPLYFIPERLFNKAKVYEQQEATEKFWGTALEFDNNSEEHTC